MNYPLFPWREFKHGVVNDKNVQSLYYLPYGAYEFDLPAQIGTVANRHEVNPSAFTVTKTKFCGFCVSNGSSKFQGVKLRDAFFHLLNSYKRVDSFGLHLNNMPDGKIAPREGFSKLVSEYKFMIYFENTEGNGYVTEKPVQCFISQTVPIYWGEPTGIINPEACVLVNPDNMHSAIKRILFLDSNDEAYAQVLHAGQTKPFSDISLFSREACYEYVKRVINTECALVAE